MLDTRHEIEDMILVGPVTGVRLSSKQNWHGRTATKDLPTYAVHTISEFVSSVRPEQNHSLSGIYVQYVPVKRDGRYYFSHSAAMRVAAAIRKGRWSSWASVVQDDGLQRRGCLHWLTNAGASQQRLHSRGLPWTLAGDSRA